MIPVAIAILLLAGGSEIAGRTILKPDPEVVFDGDFEVIDETEAPKAAKPAKPAPKKKGVRK